MPYRFKKTWTEEIAETLVNEQYHNAVITILDGRLSTSAWDIETNTKTVVGNPVVATGIHARMNWPLRSISDPGDKDYNPTVVRSGRVSIDIHEYAGELRDGMQIIVTDGGQNPDLTRWRFRVAEALNGSWIASRVFKITADGEATNGNSIQYP
jgi:hypothetical protein